MSSGKAKEISTQREAINYLASVASELERYESPTILNKNDARAGMNIWSDVLAKHLRRILFSARG